MANLVGTDFNDTLVSTVGDDVLDGRAGIDTAYYSNAPAGVTVDLTIAGPQATGGAGSDTLINIENITGSAFDDKLTGDGGANLLSGGAGNDVLLGGGGDDTLRGGAGDDVLDGGAGYDYADYNDAKSAVTVSLAVAGPQATGGAGLDTLSNIEGLVGSSFADVLTGDGGLNRLFGGNGNDTLRGGAGDDILDGGDGDDVLDGGDGFDTADYSQSYYNLSVDLSQGLTLSAFGRDTLSSIERVLGGTGSDTLKAGAVGVALIGGMGGDSLYSGAGDDTLDGGDGDDVFYLGAGADKVTGGAGNDTVNFVAGATALNIDLSTFWTSGQYASAGLTITGVELLGSVTGGAMNDTIVVGDAYTGVTTLSGGGGDDRLTGGGGSDTIIGGDGDDVLNGGGGRDFITGGAGADTLNGGAGDDVLIMDASDQAIDGGAGLDSLSFEWGTNNYAIQALNIDLTNFWTGGVGLINGATIRGVEKIETFNGSQLADRVVWGTGPADNSNRLSVSLGDGDDFASGGAMGDNLSGDAGNDTLYGGDGGDYLSGGDGVDQLYGGNGDDSFSVSTNDTIDGGAGRDVLRFFGGIDRQAWNIDLRGLWTGGTGRVNGGTITNVEDTYDIYGTNNDDTIIVGDGLVTQITYYYGEIMGREAYNGLILRGFAGDDTIVGSGGADKIYGDLGADKISGGAGDDLIVFDGKDTVDGGAGYDTITLGDPFHRAAESLDLDLRGNWEGLAGSSIVNVERFYGGYGSDYNDRIFIGDKYTLNGAEIYAGSGDDIVVGSGVNDMLYGADGTDQLSGGAGDDELAGGSGDDFLDGGAGNDTASFDGNAADYNWTANADGSLTVRDLRDPAVYGYAYSGVDMLRGVEVLRFSDKSITLASRAGLTLTGTAGADQLTGGAYDDVLNGGGGDDILIGGLGDDTLDGGDGTDLVSYAGSLGPVVIQLGMSGQQNTGAGLDKLISIEGVIGSAFADKLYGSYGADILKGGDGDDLIYASGGDDTIDGGDGYDTAEYGGYSTSYTWTQSANGSWIVTDQSGILQSGSDTLLNIEALKFQDRTINLKDPAGVITGSAGDDALVGTSGNDIFKAGAGNDSITSSAGDDIYDGGEGNDFLGFTNVSRGITVDLAVSTPQDTGDGRDTFISIDSIMGSRFDDVFRGTDGYNQINGENGNDLIEGRGGDDNLSGGAGNDVVRGGAGNDIVAGGSGNDQIFGDDGDDYIPLFAETNIASGDDVIDGGDGQDTIVAAFFDKGVIIDLGRTDRQMIADGSWVALKSVENVTGSIAGDRLTGDAGNNVITGWEGDDIIDGGKGVDTVVMQGASTDFTVTWMVDGWKVADRRPYAPPLSGKTYDGVDTVRNVEFISYSDKTVALGDGMTFLVGNVLRNTGGAAGTFANDLSVRLESGALTPASALTEIVVKAGATTSVATLAYAFFTGKIPGSAGIDYLVSPTGPNANNLNSAYYQSFNLENRYINFAVNLGKLGEGKDAFLAKYGSLSFVDATREAYKTIFGAAPTDAKIHAMIDSRVDYFATYGGDGVNGIGTKAAMVGWLLAEAQKADLGVMVRSNDAWLTDMADGSAPFAIDILDPAKGYYKADFVFGGT